MFEVDKNVFFCFIIVIFTLYSIKMQTYLMYGFVYPTFEVLSDKKCVADAQKLLFHHAIIPNQT